jgi:hypothetical protein
VLHEMLDKGYNPGMLSHTMFLLMVFAKKASFKKLSSC